MFWCNVHFFFLKQYIEVNRVARITTCSHADLIRLFQKFLSSRRTIKTTLLIASVRKPILLSYQHTHTHCEANVTLRVFLLKHTKSLVYCQNHMPLLYLTSFASYFIWHRFNTSSSRSLSVDFVSAVELERLQGVTLFRKRRFFPVFFGVCIL